MAKPPNWNRDELILALDLFFRANPIHTTEEHPETVKLSRVLNELPIRYKNV
jgi:5-methylcytosine-specific restriction protein A